MAQQLSLHRPNEITWGMALFSGSLAALAAFLIVTAIGNAGANRHGVAIHAGPPFVWLLVGFLALASLTLTVWRWKRDCYGEALIAALLSLGVTLLLLGVAAVVYREASASLTVHACIRGACATSVSPSAARSMVGAMVLLIVDLIAVALIVLNAIDGYAGRPVLPPHGAEGEVPYGDETGERRDPRGQSNPQGRGPR